MGRVIFYGERGIVNGLVLDIKDSLDKQKALLNAIKFTGGTKPDWINDIDSMKFIVELSLSEFGNPDLILIVSDKRGNKHAIFVEAKVCCYNDAAVKASASFKNNASKVNFQLALKYRFADAFIKSKNRSYIQEQPGIESDDRYKIRRIKNHNVIGLCNNYFNRVTDFSYVALTNDSSAAEPYDNPLYYPPIKSWDIDKDKFGLLSYKMLEDAGVVNRDNGYYGNATKAFLGLPADSGCFCQLKNGPPFQFKIGPLFH